MKSDEAYAKIKEDLKQQNHLRDEVIFFLRSKGLTYEDSLAVLRKAHSYLERAALKNQIQ